MKTQPRFPDRPSPKDIAHAVATASSGAELEDVFARCTGLPRLTMARAARQAWRQVKNANARGYGTVWMWERAYQCLADELVKDLKRTPPFYPDVPAKRRAKTRGLTLFNQQRQR